MARQPGPRTCWQVRLSASQRKQLKRTMRAHTAGQAAVLRARIVLAASAGLATERIARRLGVRPATVRKWRRRWCLRGLAGLGDLPRPGRPRAFPHVVVAQVKALACELPAIHGVPLSAGVLASCARRSSPLGWSRRSLRRRCGAGCTLTCSSPGAITPGSSPATRSSSPRPAGCWTCTRGCLRGGAGGRRVRHQCRRVGSS
jgi:transposase-like protein